VGASKPRGQNFLHIAAARLNFWALRAAAARGLTPLFSVVDESGWTPRHVLERHMTEMQVARQAKRATGDSRLPPWCNLFVFQPLAPTSRDVDAAGPAFADLAIEVQDDAQGLVRIHAHRVILAANSPRWRADIASEAVLQNESDAAQSRSSGSARIAQTPLTVLRLDPQCCSSAEVALFALRSLYAPASVTDSGFYGNGRLLLQLVRLCVEYELPDGLVAESQNALLSSLDEPANASLAHMVFREAKSIKLSTSARQFAARCLLCRDAAWAAVDESLQPQALEAILRELEPCFAGTKISGGRSA